MWLSIPDPLYLLGLPWCSNGFVKYIVNMLSRHEICICLDRKNSIYFLIELMICPNSCRFQEICMIWTVFWQIRYLNGFQDLKLIRTFSVNCEDLMTFYRIQCKTSKKWINIPSVQLVLLGLVDQLLLALLFLLSLRVLLVHLVDLHHKIEWFIIFKYCCLEY